MAPSRSTDPGSVASGAALQVSTPLRLGLVVVAVMAVVALSVILLPRGTPPIAHGSPSATASVTQPRHSPPPTVVPAPTSAPTTEPAPTGPAVWTGLDWSDPVTPPFTVHLDDVVPWGDRYVAVGTVETGSGPAARLLTSPDGVHWDVGFDPGTDHWPSHLVVLGNELLALSQRITPLLPPGQIAGAPPDTLVWRSTDGEHWSAPEAWPAWSSEPVAPLPTDWDQEQHPIRIGLVGVASGPTGLVAIGNTFVGGRLVPVIDHSPDGRSWTPAALPAGSDSALLNAIVVLDGRFVITGAVDVGPDPQAATAAGWYSDDGLAWIRATLEPDGLALSAGAELGPLHAASDGLLACRGRRELTSGGWRYMDAWTSKDGASWRSSSQPGQHPACDWSASDGTRIVSLGPRDQASSMPWPGVTVASASTDGVEWLPLELSSTVNDRLERFWVVPRGVIYAGERAFWFGTAIAP